MTLNKILLAASTIAALALASCSSEDAGLSNNTGKLITYETGSRFAGNHFDNGDNIAVWANISVGQESSMYFANQVVTMQDGAWSTDQNYYWPADGTLDFFAISPAPAFLPQGAEMNFVEGPSPQVDIQLAGFENNVDILSAYAPAFECPQTRPVPLRFRHALSRTVIVVVDSCKYGPVLDVNVRSFTITAKLRNQGRLDIASGQIEVGGFSHEETLEQHDKFIPAYGVDTIGVYFLIPQMIETLKVSASWDILNNGYVAETLSVEKVLENNSELKPGVSTTYKLVLRRKEHTGGGNEGDITIF